MDLLDEFATKLDELTAADDTQLYSLMLDIEFILDEIQVGFGEYGQQIYDGLNLCYEEALYLKTIGGMV